MMPQTRLMFPAAAAGSVSDSAVPATPGALVVVCAVTTGVVWLTPVTWSTSQQVSVLTATPLRVSVPEPGELPVTAVQQSRQPPVALSPETWFTQVRLSPVTPDSTAPGFPTQAIHTISSEFAAGEILAVVIVPLLELLVAVVRELTVTGNRLP